MHRFFIKQYLIGGLGILFVLISLLSDTWLYPSFYRFYAQGQAQRVQKSLIEKQKEAENFLKTTVAIPLPKLQASFQGLYKLSCDKHIFLYITQIDGSIIYYSTNSVSPVRLLNMPRDSQLQRLSNGYYLQNNIIANGLIYITLIPIQYHYSIDNQF